MADERKSVVLCTGGYDHTIKFWEAPTGTCYHTLQYAESQVNQLCVTPDKKFLAVAGNPNVSLYDINSANLRPVTSFDGHTGNVTSVGFQKDRKWMFTGSEDGTVKIWDIRAPGYQRNYSSQASINTACLHPNQGEIISGDEEGNIRVWDLTKNLCSYKVVADGKTPIRSLCVASDASAVVAATNRGTVLAWKLSKSVFELQLKLDAHNTYVLKCVLSPDCKYLATTSADHTVKIWSVNKGYALEKTLKGHQKWVWDCSFSADSAYLVSASSDKTSKLWDLKHGKVILEYRGHHKAVTSVALNDSST
eukprot:gb/GEZN01009402.1/.p1 GENE.gb/GEZN01009402.1/~~gb/GEZN01009402.1/.p1  ORF type:complete len:307 (+),score=33.42 gb/GEZN01009402.1/:198-1118(+)